MTAIPEQLYTLILEYRGGTYMAQCRASSMAQLLPIWISGLSDADLRTWGLSRVDLMDFISRQEPTALDGLQGAWCCTGVCNDDLLLLNVVKTCAG